MRIYLDKQIFSHLFKKEKTEYVELLKKLYAFKKNGLLCYSHAHLLDLKNDKTDIKYAELNFMETLVDDNYLSYHAINKTTSCYLAKPMEAFEDVNADEEKIDFTKLFEINDSFITSEQKEQLNLAKQLLTNLKLDFGFLNKDDIPKEVSEPLKKIFPKVNQSMSLMELMESSMDALKIIQEDKSVYKGLRNVSDKYINNGKFTVEYNDVDFNDDLKNSVLQKSFIEYVNSNLNPKGDKEITNYEFYTNAYFTLDLLGISKEPAKSVKFTNVLNDGYHSFYGAFCDVVISDDNGFLKKTKVLYKLLGIDTKVIHIDEFIKSFSFSINSYESSSNTFFSLLINDIKNGLITNTKKSIRFNRETKTIKTSHNYLGYFNRIDNFIDDNISYIYLYKNIINYSNFTFYREYQIVINNSIKLFGIDTNFKGEFDWNKEIEQINEHTWEGRYWDFENFTIVIDINTGTNKLGLLIKIK